MIHLDLVRERYKTSQEPLNPLETDRRSDLHRNRHKKKKIKANHNQNKTFPDEQFNDRTSAPGNARRPPFIAHVAHVQYATVQCAQYLQAERPNEPAIEFLYESHPV